MMPVGMLVLVATMSPAAVGSAAASETSGGEVVEGEASVAAGTTTALPRERPSVQAVDDDAPARPQQGAPVTPQPSASTSSYGTHIVLADLGAVVLGTALSVPTRSIVPLALTWALAAPLTHVVHGHGARAGVSLLLHVGLPALGATAGYFLPCSGRNQANEEGLCPFSQMVGLGLLGMIGATVIDAAYLAQLDDHAPLSPPAQSTAWAPTMSLGAAGSLEVGLAGTF